MIKELFYSKNCLHFKALHLNDSYNTYVYGYQLDVEYKEWNIALYIFWAILHFLTSKKQNKNDALV